MLYTNSNGKSFIAEKMFKGSFVKKHVKFFVHRFGGFGIDAELYDTKIEPTKAGIDFVVKEDLLDYRTNRVICDSGVYRISVEDFRKYAQKAVLNERHGEQYFIGAHHCTRVG
jgi:hypothetical protein